MAKSLVNVNGVKTLEVSADMFIVPNGFMKASNNFIFGDRLNVTMNGILEASDHETEVDPYMMQVWLVAENDLGCENLVDHMGHYWGIDGVKHPFGNIPSYLPANMFVGKKEGDVVTVVYPEGTTQFNKDFRVVMHLKLAQTEYRYRRFGTFEQCFDSLYVRMA